MRGSALVHELTGVVRRTHAISCQRNEDGGTNRQNLYDFVSTPHEGDLERSGGLGVKRAGISLCENGDKVSRQHAQRDVARRAPRPPARRAANASCMFDSHHIPGGRSPGTYWDHKRGGPELPWLCQFVVPSGD